MPEHLDNIDMRDQYGNVLPSRQLPKYDPLLVEQCDEIAGFMHELSAKGDHENARKCFEKIMELRDLYELAASYGDSVQASLRGRGGRQQ